MEEPTNVYNSYNLHDLHVRSKFPECKLHAFFYQI